MYIYIYIYIYVYIYFVVRTLTTKSTQRSFNLKLSLRNEFTTEAVAYSCSNVAKLFKKKLFFKKKICMIFTKNLLFSVKSFYF